MADELNGQALPVHHTNLITVTIFQNNGTLVFDSEKWCTFKYVCLSNLFPSKPSIVCSGRKPFYTVRYFLVLISSNLFNRVPRCK